jgi:hypothetical protein
MDLWNIHDVIMFIILSAFSVQPYETELFCFYIIIVCLKIASKYYTLWKETYMVVRKICDSLKCMALWNDWLVK